MPDRAKITCLTCKWTDILDDYYQEWSLKDILWHHSTKKDKHGHNPQCDGLNYTIQLEVKD